MLTLNKKLATTWGEWMMDEPLLHAGESTQAQLPTELVYPRSHPAAHPMGKTLQELDYPSTDMVGWPTKKGEPQEQNASPGKPTWCVQLVYLSVGWWGMGSSASHFWLTPGLYASSFFQ